jgi:rhamnosyltransferase
MNRLLLFVHYHKYGGLAEHVLYTLRAMRPLFARVVFISNSPLTEAAVNKLSPFCDKIMGRVNRGFDFGAWRDGLGTENAGGGVGSYDSVTLMNDLCVGPLCDIGAIYQQYEARTVDFWGLTGTSGAARGMPGTPELPIPAHLQSYFLCFNRRVVASAAWQNFWRNVADETTTDDVIRKYEMPLTGILLNAGFTAAAMAQIAENSGHGLAVKLIEQDVPFLPLTALPPLGELTVATRLIGKKSAYPPTLLKHLVNEFDRTPVLVTNDQANIKIFPMDITNHCNARCRFCFNKWGKPANMTIATFKNIAEKFLPYAENALISCLFEPSLNPDYIEIMESVPSAPKNSYYFYTTNLVKALSDEQITRLAHCKFSFINISLETFEWEKYQKLAGAKSSFFYDNLTRMAKIFADTADAPPLHFITMIIPDNYDEIIDLAEKAQKYHPKNHEFRTVYFADHLQNMWLSRERLDALTSRLDELKKRGFQISYDVSNDLEKYNEYRNGKTFTAPKERDYQVRINADGTGSISLTNVHFNVNDPKIDCFWYENQYMEMLKADAKKYEFYGEAGIPFVNDDTITARLEQLAIHPSQVIKVTGFGFTARFQTPDVVVITVNERRYLYNLIPILRGVYTGFYSVIDLSRLDIQPSDVIWLGVGFMENETCNFKQLHKIDAPNSHKADVLSKTNYI